ncbi:MAG: PHP domain-containing protein [Synergistaceae bacterium]|nr:PHP domain-containing protein [Synergistaceae bacterium]
MPSKIDLHIHTDASDGTYSPAELLTKINEAGIKIFSVTDHDTIKGAMTMKEIIRGSSAKFIPGVEFSCRIPGLAKCHILAFNYDEKDEGFREVLRTGDELRHAKFFKRIEFLRDKFNIKITDEEVAELLNIPSVGKPHLGNLLVKKGAASTRAEAIENIIDKCKTGNDKVDADFAISSINSSGVSVWAHPLGGERESELSPDKFIEILDRLISFGLQGLECYYSRYEKSKCDWLASVARERNLFISGGSDCHGTNKNIPLGKLNAENENVNPELLTILRSCV